MLSDFPEKDRLLRCVTTQSSQCSQVARLRHVTGRRVGLLIWVDRKCRADWGNGAFDPNLTLEVKLSHHYLARL
jgi:ribosomal protein L37AE/L43A